MPSGRCCRMADAASASPATNPTPVVSAAICVVSRFTCCALRGTPQPSPSGEPAFGGRMMRYGEESGVVVGIHRGWDEYAPRKMTTFNLWATV
eukprot:3495927-Pyramimonas_sp.AAC.1